MTRFNKEVDYAEHVDVKCKPVRGQGRNKFQSRAPSGGRSGRAVESFLFSFGQKLRIQFWPKAKDLNETIQSEIGMFVLY